MQRLSVCSPWMSLLTVVKGFLAFAFVSLTLFGSKIFHLVDWYHWLRVNLFVVLHCAYLDCFLLHGETSSYRLICVRSHYHLSHDWECVRIHSPIEHLLSGLMGGAGLTNTCFLCTSWLGWCIHLGSEDMLRETSFCVLDCICCSTSSVDTLWCVVYGLPVVVHGTQVGTIMLFFKNELVIQAIWFPSDDRNKGLCTVQIDPIKWFKKSRLHLAQASFMDKGILSQAHGGWV